MHVVGWSGGGPHTLACAALLSDRVASAATLASVAPWGADGLDWLEGMAEENLDEFGAAVEGPDALRRFLEPIAADRLDVAAESVAEGLGGLLTVRRRSWTLGLLAARAAAGPPQDQPVGEPLLVTRIAR